MMRGNITRRGKSSWRLKFDVGTDTVSGKRRTRYVTVRGKRQDAERELARLLNEAHDGTLIEPSKVTVAEYMRAWLSGAHGLSPKTAERYRQLAEHQIIPHLGPVQLQKLKPAQLQDWHGIIIREGGKDGRPLSARTVGHAHRVLHRALQRAVENETLPRNVASLIRSPNVEAQELEILSVDEIGIVLAKLEGHALYPIVALALATGMRRGELLALRWEDVNLGGATLRVERALEETSAGLRFKAPKTRHGRRTISLPPSGIDALRAHRLRQLELRVTLGQGKPESGALVFSTIEGAPLSPDNLSRDWRRVVTAFDLPRVKFHALRHSHASALIASGLDVLTVSRRLGHGNPVVTLKTYAHLFAKTDERAADAIEAALRTAGEH
jgi:integrase